MPVWQRRRVNLTTPTPLNGPPTGGSKSDVTQSDYPSAAAIALTPPTRGRGAHRVRGARVLQAQTNTL